MLSFPRCSKKRSNSLIRNVHSEKTSEKYRHNLFWPCVLKGQGATAAVTAGLKWPFADDGVMEASKPYELQTKV